MNRPTWETTWMDTENTIARRSRCQRAKVGAVIVSSSNRPVATGYNGPPSSLNDDSDTDHQTLGEFCSSWCPRARMASERLVGVSYSNCVSIHAEMNALLFADRRDYEGGTIYVSRACCWDCGKVIANSGLERVVMRVISEDEHREPDKTILFLRDCGMEVVVLEVDGHRSER